jgi:sec-independent protein translocase protein TatA
MLGGHLYELIIMLIIALIIFGPKRLPELGSSLGKGIREFRKASDELQDSFKTDTAKPLPAERPQYTASTYMTPIYTEAESIVTSTQQTKAQPRLVQEHDPTKV